MIDRRPFAEPTRVSTEQAELLRPRLSQFRILFVALIAGLVFFAMASTFAGPGRFVWPPSTLSLILAGASIVIAIQAFVLPVVILRNAGNAPGGDLSERVNQLSGKWFSAKLVGAALLDSCALMNLVGYFIENNLYQLAFAGFYVALMWVHFPTMNRLLDWIDAQSSPRQD